MKRFLVSVGLLGIVACSAAPSHDDAGVDAGADAGLTPNTQGWWRGKVFYEVFVRSFADSDADGVGDLPGLTAHLDDLNDGNPATGTDLGVDALWLMPIFKAGSYHGYDVIDYQQVDSAYGTMADFDAMLAAAHQRGIKVILDFVPNHTSAQHPWFVDASSGASAAHRDWYVWRGDDAHWARPGDYAPLWHSSADGSWYYGYFGGGMPDLNYRNPDVEHAITEAMTFWLQRGVDGFRVDAARYLVEGDAGTTISDQPETHAVTKRLRLALQQVNPQVLLVAEAWASADTVAEYYGDADEYQLAFTFDLAGAIFTAISAGSSDAVINTIARAETTLTGKDRGFEAPFLTNHDMVRTARKLSGDLASTKLAAATLLALPGTPFIYYGEEVGMGGGPRSDDRDKRTPLRWTPTPPTYGFTTRGSTWYGASDEDAGVDWQTERGDQQSLWHTYQQLIELRHQHSGLACGEATRQTVVGGGQLAFALLRTCGASRVLFVANFGSAPIGPLQIAVTGRPTTLVAQGLQGSVSATDQIVIEGLAARGFVFVEVL